MGDERRDVPLVLAPLAVRQESQLGVEGVLRDHVDRAGKQVGEQRVVVAEGPYMNDVDFGSSQKVAIVGLEVNSLVRTELGDPEGPEVNILGGPIGMVDELIGALALEIPVICLAKDVARVFPWSGT